MKTWMNKNIIGGIFLCLVFLLIFFSKTIYTYNLAEVTAVKPDKGKLSKTEVGYGTVQWAELKSVYIPEGGTVDEVYVNEGEYVEAGQKLFSMKYDRDENDRKLQELENDRKKLEAELKALEHKLAAADRPQAEIENTRQSLAEAQLYFNAAGSLYEMGSISAKEYREAGNQANYLRLKLDELVTEQTEQKKAHQLELEAKRLELENQIIMEEPYKNIQLVHNEKVEVTAQETGMLSSLRISEGQKVEKDLLALTIGTGNEYYLECPVSVRNNFIRTGDTCNLSNPSHQVKGMVTGVLPLEDKKMIRIHFTAEDVTAGETFEVLFQKQSETSYVLVPNAAVCQDKDGYYLKQVKRRDGLMGKEYYLERIDIFIGDSDSKNTAVIQGVTFFEPVVLSSDKTAVIGNVVMLKNAGDFFEE